MLIKTNYTKTVPTPNNMFCLKIFKNSQIKQIIYRAFSNGSPEVTALYNFHVENGGKMVNFGGYLLPVQYNDLSIINSHLFTRQSASLFDVSHMLQTEVKGTDSVEYLESVVTADLKSLELGSSVLTIFTNDIGGILDDLIITKISDDHFYIVSNAARKEHDQDHLVNALNRRKKVKENTDIRVKFFDTKQKSLLALQGPKAADVLQSLVDVDLSKLYFMNSIEGDVREIGKCRITRCGYTGEDGFEISLPSSNAVSLSKQILKSKDVKLAGLGARDSLRLEAGLCLYGNDITSRTTPVEAALTWLVAKRRRQEANFPGATQILKQIKEGSAVKRVGLISEVGPPARHGAAILNEEGKPIGDVTSGCPSPSIGKNVAMGYVPASYAKAGTRVSLKIREKLYEAVVSKMPFVKSNYYNKPK